MSDLVKRLRNYNRMSAAHDMVEAAARIEALERIETAARNYFMCAVQDEAAERECCVSDEHHELARAFRAALDKDAEK